MQDDPLRQRISQGMPYVESSYLDQDTEAIEQLRRSQGKQTFTFNMITNVHMDYMGLYVEGSIEVRNEPKC